MSINITNFLRGTEGKNANMRLNSEEFKRLVSPVYNDLIHKFDKQGIKTVIQLMGRAMMFQNAHEDQQFKDWFDYLTDLGSTVTPKLLHRFAIVLFERINVCFPGFSSREEDEDIEEFYKNMPRPKLPEDVQIELQYNPKVAHRMVDLENWATPPESALTGPSSPRAKYVRTQKNKQKFLRETRKKSKKALPSGSRRQTTI